MNTNSSFKYFLNILSWDFFCQRDRPFLGALCINDYGLSGESVYNAYNKLMAKIQASLL